MFFALTRHKTAENHVSSEQLLRVIRVVLSLAQIKHFSIPIISCLLFLSKLLGIVGRISEKPT